MDELEQLKQDWNKIKPNEFKTYSEKELFAMTKKSSISITKWILIIGIIEFLFWIIYRNNYLYRFQISFIFITFTIYSYFRIYNYNNTQKLMRSIFRLKNSILFYTYYIFFTEIIFRLERLYTNIKRNIYGEISTSFLLGTIVGLSLFLYILYIFYKKTYGKLLKKLKENYNELNKIETSQK